MMRRRVVSLWIGVGGMLCVAACAREARAQHESLLGSGDRSMQSGTSLGRSDYGYGLLDLGRNRSGGTMLESSIAGGGNDYIARQEHRLRSDRDQNQLGMPQPLLGPQFRRRDDETIGPEPESMARDARRQALAILVANQYLDTIGANISEGLSKKRAVTTLVPESPGMYRDLMARGEKSMLAGSTDIMNVHKAIDTFTEAQLLTHRNPDVLLSLAHAQFLVSRYSYVSASEYLQEAVSVLPELPLVELEPKSFFGGTEVYDNRMKRLEEHLQARPDDPDALFLRAYFKWFERDPESDQAAADSLRRAWLLARQPKVMGNLKSEVWATSAPARSAATRPASGPGASPEEGPPAADYDAPGRRLSVSIETFWKAMVKTGRVTGTLSSTTAPAATSRRGVPTSVPNKSVGISPGKP